jgi:hypothetical protein
MMFNSSVRTAKKTSRFTVAKFNWLTLFKEIIGVYWENRTKPKYIVWAKCRVPECSKQVARVVTTELPTVNLYI